MITGVQVYRCMVTNPMASKMLTETVDELSGKRITAEDVGFLAVHRISYVLDQGLDRYAMVLYVNPLERLHMELALEPVNLMEYLALMDNTINVSIDGMFNRTAVVGSISLGPLANSNGGSLLLTIKPAWVMRTDPNEQTKDSTDG